MDDYKPGNDWRDGARRECLRYKIRGLQADFTRDFDFWTSKM